MKLKEVVNYLDNIIDLSQVSKEPSNNGLQIEGADEVNKIAFSVDINCDTVREAAEMNADMLFAHHGFSWYDSLKYITNYNSAVIRPAIKNDLSIYAAHLPLDGNPDIGHNACLAEMIELKDITPFAPYAGCEIGKAGSLNKPIEANELAVEMYEILSAMANDYAAVKVEQDLPDNLIVLGRENMVQNIGIVSGGGGMDALNAAIDMGLDCLITGEINHTMYHYAKYHGVAVIALGHYLSEIIGVIAVMEKVKSELDIECCFIDAPTGL